MLRLLFDAHTVQNLSLKEGSVEMGIAAGATASFVPSRLGAGDCVAGGATDVGGGARAWGVLVRLWRRASRGSTDMLEVAVRMPVYARKGYRGCIACSTELLPVSSIPDECVWLLFDRVALDQMNYACIYEYPQSLVELGQLQYSCHHEGETGILIVDLPLMMPSTLCRCRAHVLLILN